MVTVIARPEKIITVPASGL